MESRRLLWTPLMIHISWRLSAVMISGSFFDNIDSPGEQHKYAVVPIKHLSSLLPQEATVITLHDVACVLSRSLSQVSPSVKLYGLTISHNLVRCSPGFGDCAPSICGHCHACTRSRVGMSAIVSLSITLSCALALVHPTARVLRSCGQCLSNWSESRGLH
jgi:hypothetical protein